jgi:nicotinamidase-related amidase
MAGIQQRLDTHPKGDGSPAVPIAEVLAGGPHLYRETNEPQEKMPNFKSTEGGPHGMPLTFWAQWELNSRPRRIALLMDDAQEEYRPYAEGILPNLTALRDCFREKGCPIAWSSWSRQFDDGVCNSMDRWYGTKGTGREENAIYIFQGEKGLQPLAECGPNEEEEKEWFYHSKALDMFFCFRADGKSFLDEKLKAEGVDTVVITGLWTDECIIATAYSALARGYDVVVVSDAVATATAHHDIALTVMNATSGKVLTTAQVIEYMTKEFELGEVGAVKGVGDWPECHHDGRKNSGKPNAAPYYK